MAMGLQRDRGGGASLPRLHLDFMGHRLNAICTFITARDDIVIKLERLQCGTDHNLMKSEKCLIFMQIDPLVRVLVVISACGDR